MRPPGWSVEREFARLARGSHGVVTRRRLLAAGVTAAEIKQRIASGSLLRVHRGVYRVGHRAPSVEATYIAAVLACGEGAALSGRAAGSLLRLLRGGTPVAEVTAPVERNLSGVRVRRARDGIIEATVWRGVPVTTAACTLVDLAGALDESELARACHEAQGRHGTTPEAVEDALRRRPLRPGAGALRRVLGGEVPVALSALEARFLRRLGDEGLPLPETNTPAGTFRVDCRWPGRRLTVEVDSYRYHRSRHAWEQDRRREREAHARGDELRRYTYDDVFASPGLMLAELRALLG